MSVLATTQSVLRNTLPKSVSAMTTSHLRCMCSNSSAMKYKYLEVSSPAKFVTSVAFNRPEKRNSLPLQMWREIKECFEQLSDDPDCRCVVLSGNGKIFCAGIDLMDFMQNVLSSTSEMTDVGRKAFFIDRTVAYLQDCFTAIELCPKPVISAVHNACVGAGVDIITACDIRHCSADAWFQVKEVDIGLAADVGTLQRLPKVVNNQSVARELCYTARKVEAEEALKLGLVSGIHDDKESMMKSVVELAKLIAEKSPIAVQITKKSLVYSRDHSVQEGLNHIRQYNLSMLQSEDIMKAAQASVTKEPAEFSKL